MKVGMALGFGVLAKSLGVSLAAPNPSAGGEDITKITKTDVEWKALLTPMQYRVLRHEDTEPPFTNEYHQSKAKGIYQCAGCTESQSPAHGTCWPGRMHRSNNCLFLSPSPMAADSVSDGQTQ
jgi:hypothetical protein